MIQHTATPYIAHRQGARWLICAAGRLGGKGTPAGLQVLWEVARGRPTDGEAQEANAAFIVRACNSHDALLAACKKAIAHTADPGLWVQAMADAIADAE